jgi:hypothetical protein
METSTGRLFVPPKHGVTDVKSFLGSMTFESAVYLEHVCLFSRHKVGGVSGRGFP